MTQELILPTPAEPEDMPFVFDPAYIHKKFTHGDLTVLITWDFGEKPDAALILTWTNAPKDVDESIPLCVVLRNDAWKWSRTHNDDRVMVGYHGFGQPPTSEEWQDLNAKYHCIALALDPYDRRSPLRVRSLIEDYLDDLIMCPPAPDREGVGEAVFTTTSLETGSVTEHVVKDF